MRLTYPYVSAYQKSVAFVAPVGIFGKDPLELLHNVAVPRHVGGEDAYYHVCSNVAKVISRQVLENIELWLIIKAFCQHQQHRTK